MIVMALGARVFAIAPSNSSMHTYHLSALLSTRGSRLLELEAARGTFALSLKKRLLAALRSMDVPHSGTTQHPRVRSPLCSVRAFGVKLAPSPA
jgi:hypothetical protein